MALKALVALVPALVLLAGSALLLSKVRSIAGLLPLIGVARVGGVVFTHIREALGPGWAGAFPIALATISTSEASCSGSRSFPLAICGTPSRRRSRLVLPSSSSPVLAAANFPFLE